MRQNMFATVNITKTQKSQWEWTVFLLQLQLINNSRSSYVLFIHKPNVWPSDPIWPCEPKAALGQVMLGCWHGAYTGPHAGAWCAPPWNSAQLLQHSHVSAAMALLTGCIECLCYICTTSSKLFERLQDIYTFFCKYKNRKRQSRTMTPGCRVKYISVQIGFNIFMRCCLFPIS